MASQLKVAGLQTVSMLDWPGKLAAVLFIKGCNLRCPYCHNPELVLNSQNGQSLSLKEIREQLLAKKNWLDGVVVTGGEPTIYDDLPVLLKEVKALNLKVKLDTNGTAPDFIKTIIKAGLIDFVALDVKTVPDKYDLVTKNKRLKEEIKLTLKTVAESGLPYELRTTVVPGLVSAEDVLAIAKLLRSFGFKKYILQQFNPQVVLDPALKTVKPLSGEHLKELACQCSAYLKTEVRGVR